ncbi:hypothetical protein BH10BAC3_BH10BAC3_31600 [soil metagenome]
MKPVSLAEAAIKDLEEWRKTDAKIIGKIIDLIAEISKTPYEGTGKPEPLKHN